MTDVQQHVSFIELPVELIYRVCDYLDTKTILLSFRNVCVHFYTIANNYNRYKFHFNTLSKTEFHCISRLIQPQNIISLHLWYINKEIISLIELFFSLFNIDQLIRLNYLTIWNIEEYNLNKILHHITRICQLKSFSMYSSISISNNETLTLLDQLLSQSSLRSVRLMFDVSSQDKFSWPIQCFAEKIDITNCNIEQLHSILNNSPNLRRLSIYDCKMINFIEKNDFISNSLKQLTHLTFNQMKISIDELESILYLTPLLTHLDIRNFKTSFKSLQRLSQWEDFIKNNLSLLKKFKFFLTCNEFNVNDIQLLIDEFRRPFWLKEKRWTITCEVHFRWRWSELTIYLSSQSQIFFPHQCDYQTIFCSTSTMINDDDDQQNISTPWNIFLTAKHNVFSYGIEWYKSIITAFLHNMNELALQIDSIESIESLIKFLWQSNVFKVTRHMWLIFDGVKFTDMKLIRYLLRLQKYVHSLGICSRYGSMEGFIDEIFDWLELRIDQLKVKTDDLNFMKWIIERIEGVKSIKFLYYYPLPIVWTELIEWLTLKGEIFSSEQDKYSLTISFQSRTTESCHYKKRTSFLCTCQHQMINQ